MRNGSIYGIISPRATARRALLRWSALVAVALLAPLAAAQSRFVLASPGASGAEADPQRNSNIYGHTVSQLVADTLLLYYDGDYVPALATSWELSEDELTYTFHLRGGVKFHNGVTLTAEAVKASFERITDPDDPLPSAGRLSEVTSVTTPDDLTVVVTLGAPNPDFLLNLNQVWIIEPGSAADGAVPVGSGPYVIAEYEPDQQIVMTRFEDYWGGPANIETIVTRNIPEPATLVLELEAGTVDAIMFAPPDEVARLGDAGFDVISFGSVNTAFVALNNARLADVELRRAICYAVDRDVLLNTAYAGLGQPELTIALPGTWAQDPSVPGYGYDPDQAAAILEAAGYVDTNGDGIREKDGQPLDLNFQARGDGAWLLATQIIQQFLSDVGIGSTITTSERNTYYTNVRTGEYDIGWWIDNANPEPPIYEYAFHSAEYWNLTQRGDDLDALIEAGRSSADRAVRAPAYFQLQRAVYEQAVQCPQFWIEQAHVVTSKLQGVKVSSMGVLLNAHQWRLE
ncbi:MAG: ABC transporter substrate-binding protein [Trueperaceae bacterium]|nr:ABC transporter substrate-binding protein [Trueperaceae bacterium]MCC6309839.1 ABC transporter substrate-binding protein [Trueperaceae bacterium]